MHRYYLFVDNRSDKSCELIVRFAADVDAYMEVNLDERRYVVIRYEDGREYRRWLTFNMFGTSDQKLQFVAEITKDQANNRCRDWGDFNAANCL